MQLNAVSAVRKFVCIVAGMFTGSTDSRNRSRAWSLAISAFVHALVITALLLTHAATTGRIALRIVPVVYAAGPAEPSHVVRTTLYLALPDVDAEPASIALSEASRIERSAAVGTSKKDLPDGLIPMPSDLTLSENDGGQNYPSFLPLQFAKMDGTLDLKVDLPEPSVGPKPESAATPAAVPDITPGGNVQLARAIRRVIPVYPEVARLARVEGSVQVHATINEQGLLENIEVISGHPLLVPAAMECLAGWRYEPARLNGRPISSSVDISVNFKLNRTQP